MKVLQVYTDFADAMEELNDAERGRLFMAMLNYARSGARPVFRGGEKVLWPVAKGNIDKQIQAYHERCETNRRNAASRYESLPEPANRSESHPIEGKEKDKEKDKDNYINTLPSFVHSPGEDPEADRELERMIDRLQLHVYRGSEQSFARSVESAIRVMWYSNTIKVNGRRIGQGAVRSVLKELTIGHVDFILSRLRNMLPEDKVVNGQAYLISCIYNAPSDCSVNAQREA